MPQVIASPEEMRSFASTLERVLQDLRQAKSSTSQQYEDLRESWRDQQYKQFARSFEDLDRDLDSFLRDAAAYAHYLRLKAARADDYLRR